AHLRATSLRHCACVCAFVPVPPTTDIYTLSLHDALPISAPPSPHSRPLPATAGSALPGGSARRGPRCGRNTGNGAGRRRPTGREIGRAQSELQSRENLVCRLLLEKKKKARTTSCSAARPH